MKTKYKLAIIIGIMVSCIALYFLTQLYTCLYPPIETHRPSYDLDLCFDAWTRGYLPWS